MKYEYWDGNEKPPATMPEGCECYAFNKWHKEDNEDTGTWSEKYLRRWPAPVKQPVSAYTAAPATLSAGIKPAKKVKTKVEYVYWKGGKPPATMPEGCEYYGFNKWQKEDNIVPSLWSPAWKRRWPKAKLRKPYSGGDGYVYWETCCQRPDKLPCGCEYLQLSDGKVWHPETEPPSEWGKLGRRWPEPKALTAKDLLKALCSCKVRGTIRVDGVVSVTALGDLTKAQWLQLTKLTK